MFVADFDKITVALVARHVAKCEDICHVAIIAYIIDYIPHKKQNGGRPRYIPVVCQLDNPYTAE